MSEADEHSKPFEVFWSLNAAKDLRCILDYLRAENPKSASKIFKKIQDKAALLKTAPFFGKVVPELDVFNIKQYRQLIEKPWRLIYKVQKQSVFVMALLDARRNIEDILLNRFLTLEDEV